MQVNTYMTQKMVKKMFSIVMLRDSKVKKCEWLITTMKGLTILYGLHGFYKKITIL